MLQGRFIDSQEHKIFITQYGEANSDKSVLLLPSLFEEMNLCRAIVAKQAWYLAKKGYTVYALDYAGCGDSEGEINQVTPGIWQQNVKDTIAWLKTQDISQISLWGIRFGALLAIECLPDIAEQIDIKQVLMWKPVTKGKQFMTQFLRLKQANSMIQGETKTNWRQTILDGQETEVAGYPINAQLLGSIDKLAMPKELNFTTPIHWFELAAGAITPAIQIQTKSWNAQQFGVTCFEGSAFWQIPEIFAQPNLHEPTYTALEKGL